MSRSVGLLINPAAGRGRALRVAADVRAALVRAGVDVTMLAGRDATQALQVARDAVARGVDALVSLGGDGMANVALQAVAGGPTALGVLPAGTGNDLAAALGMPRRDPVAAARTVGSILVAGAARPMDAVRTPHGWFGCVLGAGFDSRVNDRANRTGWPRGRLRYPVAVLGELGGFRPLPFVVTVDGERIATEAMLVAVGNAPSYGAGMRVCPDARLDDGLVDVTVVGSVGTAELLRVLPKVYSGAHRDHPAVRMLRGREVVLESPGVTAYADGEPLAALPVSCAVQQGAVQVLATGGAGSALG